MTAWRVWADLSFVHTVSMAPHWFAVSKPFESEIEAISWAQSLSVDTKVEEEDW